MADENGSREKIVCLGWHGIIDKLIRKNIHRVQDKHELLLVDEWVTEKAGTNGVVFLSWLGESADGGIKSS